MRWQQWIYTVPLKLRSLVHRRRIEDDLDDEIAFHLTMQAHAHRQAGMSEEEAGRRARLDFSGVDQAKESCRDTLGFRWAEDLLRDGQYAARALRKSPGFTAAAVVTLALGLGANTALFSVISAVLLRPLPYPQADRLIQIRSAMPASGLPRSPSAMPDYRVWRSTNHTFQEMGAYYEANYTLTGGERPEQLEASRMTASMWTVLESPPAHGAAFTDRAEQWGSHRVVVISDGFWRRRLGGDAAAIGRVLQLSGEPHAVIGIMPPGFQFPHARTDLWTPAAFAPGDVMNTRNNHFVNVLGRLKPSGRLAEARANMSTIASQLERQFPENAGLGVDLIGLQDEIVADARPALWLLWGAVAFVLLIACTNVANLLLARAISRRHEFTIRMAIGAGRGRLVRQLLAEQLLLSVLGAAAGLGLAVLLLRAIPALGPIGVPRLDDVTVDGGVIAFTAALAAAAGLGAGFWPAWHVAQLNVSENLKESARSATGGRARGRTRNLLVVAEISLCFVLLIGAGLLIVSLVRLKDVDPGFQPERLLTARISLSPIRYKEPARIRAFVTETTALAAAAPGITSAGITTTLPLDRAEWGKRMTIAGRPAPPSLAQVPTVYYRQISPGYLQTMGAGLRRGRFFTDQDGPGAAGVALVSETLARRFWPGQDPIGARISMYPPESLVTGDLARELPKDFKGFPRRTIVGIVGDVHQRGLDLAPHAEVFIPIAQGEDPLGDETAGGFFLVVRTTGAPLDRLRQVEAVVHRVDPNLPLANVRTMESLLDDSMARRRFSMQLLCGLAAVAVALAMVGIYGVISYGVGQRRKEFGIRAALGASAGALRWLVLSEGLRLALAGVGLGLLLAAPLSYAMREQLFQVSALSPTLYAGAGVLLLTVAAAACGIPALTATRVEPAVTLRQD